MRRTTKKIDRVLRSGVLGLACALPAACERQGKPMLGAGQSAEDRARARAADVAATLPVSPSTIPAGAATRPGTIPTTAAGTAVAVEAKTRPAPPAEAPSVSRDGEWDVRRLDGAGDLFDVAFFDATSGVCVGAGDSLYFTADGGRSWARSRTPGRAEGTPPFTSVAVAGPGEAYALTGVLHTIYRTADAGRSWEPLPLPRPRGVPARHAVAGGGAYLVMTPGAIQRWDTASAAWTKLTQLPDAADGYSDFALPHPRHGYAVAGAPFPHVAVTSDGGRSWLKTRMPDAAGDDPRVQFVDHQTGWVLARRGPLLHTDDGGRSWVAQDAGVSAGRTLGGLYFADASRGYVASVGEEAGGVIVRRTVDGGKSWDALPPLNAPVNGFTFASNGDGWAVGPAGLIARLGGEAKRTPAPGTMVLR